jgi:CubicO group peptidase (beta-lactamase class C family)
MRIAAIIALSGACAGAPTPSDEAIRKIIGDRSGVVVGVIDSNGRKAVMNGVDRSAVFEIGSVTKVFTALLLAGMAQSGEVALSDPIAKFLPEGVKAPERGGRAITLRDLAMHTSGLPRMPANLLPKNSDNPYADYTVEDLYRFIPTVELAVDPGSKYEYSNLGAGLLGNLLARRAGTSYEALLKSRILTPLQLKDTAITLSPEMKNRLTPGHNSKLEPVGNWDLPALAGAGALRSTVDDMLTFIAANLGYTKSKLSPAIESLLAERRPTGNQGLEIGLGWHISKRDGKDIVWHNGGTGGYYSFVGFSPDARVGVAVLANSAQSVDYIGMALLNPAAVKQETKVDPKLFDGYVGRYQLAPGFVMTVTREGNQLFTQATGQPKIEVFAMSERVFFPRVVEAEIEFQTDENGRATQLVLRQGGREMPAKRLEGEPPAARQRTEIAVEEKILEGYEGRYQLAPGFLIEITRDGSRLFAQATGQPKFELFAESPKEFFYKVVDAQITFETDRLILHQNGRNVPGDKLK